MKQQTLLYKPFQKRKIFQNVYVYQRCLNRHIQRAIREVLIDSTDVGSSLRTEADIAEILLHLGYDGTELNW